MSSFSDYIALTLTVTICAGTVYGILRFARFISKSMESTKESLKNKGLDVSAGGVKVKTSRRLDREGYVDATQRGLMKAMNASSFGHASPIDAPEQINRNPSSSSSTESKKRRLFKYSSGRGD